MHRRTLTRELVLSFALIALLGVVLGAGGLWVLLSLGTGDPALRATILVGAVVFCVTGGAMLLVWRTLVRPLQRLARHAESVAGGELARRVPAPSELAELASIGASVNRLAESVVVQQAERKRAEKLASVGRLAAGVAHDIGNPLGAINAYVHILRSRVDDASDAAGALDGVEREVERIDRIARGLLDYARPRTPASIPVGINATLRSAVRLLSDQGALRRLAVEQRLDDGEPEIFGQCHDLEQLFVNLLLNAIAASPDGGRIAVHTLRVPRAALEEGVVRRAGDPPLAIRPRPPIPHVTAWLERVKPPAQVVSVIVADSGVGIAPEDRERIFEPFFTTKPPRDGTGLGLAIVASIVESLNGTIWMEPAREGGAAFHMLFPLARVGNEK